MRANSKVLPHSTESMGCTSLSKMKSSLSSTSVLASLPLLMGMLWGVGYIYVTFKYLLVSESRSQSSTQSHS
jgi:hypothetical protein